MCPFICALFVHPSPAVCRPNDLITQLGGSNKSKHGTPSFTENKLIVHWDKVQVKVTRLTPGGPPRADAAARLIVAPPVPLQSGIRGRGVSWKGMRGRFYQMGCFKKQQIIFIVSVPFFHPRRLTALRQYLSTTLRGNGLFSPLFTALQQTN